MIPVVALVGRPNVGKSTLFNRITKSRNALVANFPGLTRDRQYGEASFAEHKFIVIDTGGITGNEQGLSSHMTRQAQLAIQEADVVLFVVDARDGLTPADEDIANHLREAAKSFLLVVNKIDGINIDVALGDFYALGTQAIYPTTATHGRGVVSLLESEVEQLPAVELAVADE